MSDNTVNTKEFGAFLKDLGLVGSVEGGVVVTRVVFGALAQLVSEGKTVKIRKFGSFVPRHRKGGTRILRGEVREIPDKKVMTLRTSTSLRSFLNGEVDNPLHDINGMLSGEDSEESNE